MSMVYRNDGFDTMREMFQDKVVHIYPSDTKSKNGRVKDINPAGITFLITASNCPSYEVGKLHFISFSSRLSFGLIEANNG